MAQNHADQINETQSVSRTIFRKTSLDRVNSPEQLNDYIHIATPSIWLVLAAVFVLLAGLLVWGLAGRLPTTVPAAGIGQDNQITAYVAEDAAPGISPGMEVTAGDIKGTVIEIAELPVSYDEIKALYGSDYIASQLCQSDYCMQLTISLDATVQESRIYQLAITTDTIRPIDFLFN